jgi:hypothetical protein
MSPTDEELVAWYHARDVFFGLNGETSLYWRGRQLAEACVATVEEAAWFCRVVPPLEMGKFATSGMIAACFKAALDVATDDWELGRAACFLAIVYPRIDTDLIRNVGCGCGYPLAIGLWITNVDFFDQNATGRRWSRTPPPPRHTPFDASVVRQVAEQHKEPRCLYWLAQQVPEGNWTFCESSRPLIQRAAELGLAKAQYLYAVHWTRHDHEQVFWLAKAARHGHKDAEEVLQASIACLWTKYKNGFGAQPDAARAVYQIGLSMRDTQPMYSDHEILTCIVSCADLQVKWERGARQAVDTWTLIALRVGRNRINRDIRRMVSQWIWAQRYDWGPHPSEKSLLVKRQK